MTQNWSKIVPDAYAGNMLFYRNDGVVAVGHIDQNGKLQQTDSGANFTQNWSIIVADGIGNLLFYRNDGSSAVLHIDQNGKMQQTDSKVASMTQNWSQIVASSGKLFFYRNDGIGAVGYIDANGKLQQTDSLAGATQNWSAIVADYDGFLFYRADGIGAIGHIDANGKFQQTQSISGLTQNWSNIIAYSNDDDCLFNWAEKNYPQFLSPAGAVSQILSPYYYRYYSGTHAYLGVTYDTVYYLTSNGALANLGGKSGWLTQAGCNK